ncbi:MAG: hypothetical protein WCL71_04725 [Deltaproteobacteria bacterium]
MNTLEAEIAITALHATGEYSVLRKLNLERDSRFTRAVNNDFGDKVNLGGGIKGYSLFVCAVCCSSF